MAFQVTYSNLRLPFFAYIILQFEMIQTISNGNNNVVDTLVIFKYIDVILYNNILMLYLHLCDT